MPHSSLHVPCVIYSFLLMSSFCSLLYLPPFISIPFFPLFSLPLSLLFTLLLICSSPFCLHFRRSLSIPTVALLNKCISHMVELIYRSFSSSPYGPTVKLHKVFKVNALQTNICLLWVLLYPRGKIRFQHYCYTDKK